MNDNQWSGLFCSFVLLVAVVESLPPTKPTVYETKPDTDGSKEALYRIRGFIPDIDDVQLEEPTLESLLLKRRPRSSDLNSDATALLEQYSVTPQVATKEDPDCFVRSCQWVRVGGRCKRLRGGIPFCLADHTLYFQHPDCSD